MPSDIDDTLAAIKRLSAAIGELQEGPEREALVAHRDEMRARARLAADVSRPRALLESELQQVATQLAAVDDVAIKPAFSEGYKLITDPSAYRRRINESIAANEAGHRAQLLERQAELRAALAALDQSETS